MSNAFLANTAKSGSEASIKIKAEKILFEKLEMQTVRLSEDKQEVSASCIHNVDHPIHRKNLSLYLRLFGNFPGL